jgi:hypothetical protein
MAAPAAACAFTFSCKPGCTCAASMGARARQQQQHKKRAAQEQYAATSQSTLAALFPSASLPPVATEAVPEHEACSSASAPAQFEMLFGAPAAAAAEAEAAAAAEAEAEAEAMLVPLVPTSKRKRDKQPAGASSSSSEARRRPPPPPPAARGKARAPVPIGPHRSVSPAPVVVSSPAPKPTGRPAPKSVPTSAAAAAARRHRWQLAADTLDDLVPLSKLDGETGPVFQCKPLQSNRAYEEAVRMQLSEPGAWLTYVRRQQATPKPAPSFAAVMARAQKQQADRVQRKKCRAAARLGIGADR